MAKGTKFIYITEPYNSNCLIETIKAKIKNKNIKIYYCKPRICANGKIQMAHFMWSDETADYDFSDDEEHHLPWYKCFWFTGKIRKFPAGFAKRYSHYRNRKRVAK